MPKNNGSLCLLCRHCASILTIERSKFNFCEIKEILVPRGEVVVDCDKYEKEEDVDEYYQYHLEKTEESK